MIKNNKAFFNPWETIHESNPQEMLEREEKVTLVPLLIMQGALDNNVLPPAQEKFAKTYQAAGGACGVQAVREFGARVGRRTGTADRQGARDRQGVHRPPAEGLIADEVQQTGAVDHAPVYPREVVKRAFELSATAVVLVHKIPTRDPTSLPSCSALEGISDEICSA